LSERKWRRKKERERVKKKEKRGERERPDVIQVDDKSSAAIVNHLLHLPLQLIPTFLHKAL
jgi:hypothetical protein